jgi:hypothetical protein
MDEGAQSPAERLAARNRGPMGSRFQRVPAGRDRIPTIPENSTDVAGGGTVDSRSRQYSGSSASAAEYASASRSPSLVTVDRRCQRLAEANSTPPPKMRRANGSR